MTFTIPTHINLLPSFTEHQLRQAVEYFLNDQPDWINNAIAKDPALNSKPQHEAEQEVLMYQGLHAAALHYKANYHYRKAQRVQSAEKKEKELLEARALSQAARGLTQIEIHPGATIGEGLFIDHGAGIVIGETAIIGKRATLYQGVTLGNAGVFKDDGKRRHPKIGDDARLYTHAKLLGPMTFGNKLVVAANAELLGNITGGDNIKIGLGAKVNGGDTEVTLGNGVRIRDNAQIIGPVKIGNNVIIEEGAQIIGDVVIEDNVVIKSGVRIVADMPRDRSFIPSGKEQKKTRIIIGEGARIETGVTVFRDIPRGAQVLGQYGGTGEAYLSYDDAMMREGYEKGKDWAQGWGDRITARRQSATRESLVNT